MVCQSYLPRTTSGKKGLYHLFRVLLVMLVRKLHMQLHMLEISNTVKDGTNPQYKAYCFHTSVKRFVRLLAAFRYTPVWNLCEPLLGLNSRPLLLVRLPYTVIAFLLVRRDIKTTYHYTP